MARTIESAGVEIKEIDLSLNASLPVGTNVLVHGFAQQGPTDELIYVTSMSEFEQIYGIPTNAAERYFYHTAKQIINSPGKLVCTRLPYGLSGGDGYGSEYSALIYPMSSYVDGGTQSVTLSTFTDHSAPVTAVSATFTTPTNFTSFDVGTINITVSSTTGWIKFIDTTYTNTLITLSASRIGLVGTILANNPTYTVGLNLSGNDGAGPVNAAISATYTSTNAASSYINATNFVIGAPTQIVLSEAEYTAWESGQINWATSSVNTSISSYDHIGNGGLIILNDLKTTIDNVQQGFYIALTDNTVTDDSTFDSIEGIDYNYNDSWSGISETRLEFDLSGTDIDDSYSEMCETLNPQRLFNIDEYNDSIIVSVTRLKETLYGSGSNKTLDKSLPEQFVGSFDSYRKEPNPNTTSMDSFFLGSVVNSKSTYITVYINPYIASKGGTWTDSSTGLPSKTVRLDGGFNHAYALGPFVDVSNIDNKSIGNVPTKLERSLRLAENTEQIPIDLVLDSGISTIWSAVRSPGAVTSSNDCTDYDDTEYLYGVNEADPANTDTKYLRDPDDGSSSTVQNNWETIFNLYNTFCQTTRKDCMLVADALRHIYVQGKDQKVLDDVTKTFSQHVYYPTKNLVGASNSNYATIYGNWVKLYDNVLSDFCWIPFSGFAGNIMVNVDSNLQPWYAPAGLNNGIIRNIVDLAINPTQKQRDYLYRVNVNPVVYFPGDGYTIWGQKTLQKKPSAFDRINVRRLFLTLEKATLAILRYFVFEPNTVFTRTRVVNVLKPIFEIAKNNEGVYDYLIVCDERNNPASVTDNNELVVDIYIKPVRTAEFILVNFVATRTDQDFTELL